MKRTHLRWWTAAILSLVVATLVCLIVGQSESAIALAILADTAATFRLYEKK